MLTLAWRNVWRNARRSLITILSIGCGLAAILFGQSLIKTIQFQLIEKATGIIAGHLQVQERGVRDLKFPDKYLGDPSGLREAVARLPNVAAVSRRIEVTGLISSKKDSNGIFILGIEPEAERRVTTMHTYLSAGSFLGSEQDGVFLGSRMAELLGVGLGDKVVLMASASDGSMGAELFRVVGLFHTGSQTFDAQIAYVPLARLQEMLAVGDKITNLMVRLEDHERLRESREAVDRALRGRPVQVVTWEQVDHELVGIRKYQNALLRIILAVVFFIVALGILNSLLMSMFERMREFGVLMAMGARPGFVVRLVVLEACLLGALGAALGLAVGSGLILHFGRAGLALPLGDAVSYFMPFDAVLFLRFNWPTHLAALAAVFATSLVSGLPPALKAARQRPVESLRQL